MSSKSLAWVVGGQEVTASGGSLGPISLALLAFTGTYLHHNHLVGYAPIQDSATGAHVVRSLQTLGIVPKRNVHEHLVFGENLVPATKRDTPPKNQLYVTLKGDPLTNLIRLNKRFACHMAWEPVYDASLPRTKGSFQTVFGASSNTSIIPFVADFLARPSALRARPALHYSAPGEPQLTRQAQFPLAIAKNTLRFLGVPAALEEGGHSFLLSDPQAVDFLLSLRPATLGDVVLKDIPNTHEAERLGSVLARLMENAQPLETLFANGSNKLEPSTAVAERVIRESGRHPTVQPSRKPSDAPAARAGRRPLALT